MSRIRPIETRDRAEWLRMLGGLYPNADHVAVVDAFLGGTPHEELLPSAVFVAEREKGGLAGFLELSVRNYAERCTGATPYVESWYVDADMRGRGVGRDLMSAAEAWARDRGYRELASDTDVDNEQSVKAHGRLGFEIVETTIHLRKPLERSPR